MAWIKWTGQVEVRTALEYTAIHLRSDSKPARKRPKKVEFSWNSLYGIYGSKHGAEPGSLQKVAILLNLEMGELGKRRELDPPR